MSKHRLSPADHQRISEAIREAETRTAGEIFCVVAHASASYFFSAAAIMALALLVASLGAAFLVEAWWLSIRLPWFVLIQILAFAACLLVLWMWPGVALALAPRPIQFSRAHDNALRQFLARNVHVTSERTGVLIFVSLAERYAEIIADEGIDRLVPAETWDAVVAELVEAAGRGRLADGFVGAIERVGELLAAHFPVRPLDRNELDDHVIEI
ncbi:MAG: TPM domain-containing protein [Rhizobiaceae bacterium]|nr:TPM domain-containing protein [Rhizobiaceae bacterium]